MDNQTHQEVQRYYGETLASSADLKTSACCTSVVPTGRLREAMGDIHEEVAKRYYGCGLVLPEALEGLRVLDLGCGAGRDVYLLSRLVGAQGSVVGVDMTPAQLDVARRYQAYHADKFGYTASNVEFFAGNIERLDELPLADHSFDLIVSNCVINLAVDKPAVFRSAKRLLKPGGEMYFSDIYADRRIPKSLAADPVLYGECLAGALYWNDFLTLATDTGFARPLLVSSEALSVDDAEIRARLGAIRFSSVTCRLFGCDRLERGEENYGQQAVYRGGIAEHPDALQLDAATVFHKDCPVAVSGNTARLLQQSRFSAYFEIIGSFCCHIGSFGSNLGEVSFAAAAGGRPSGGCC